MHYHPYRLHIHESRALMRLEVYSLEMRSDREVQGKVGLLFPFVLRTCVGMRSAFVSVKARQVKRTHQFDRFRYNKLVYLVSCFTGLSMYI